MQKHQQHQQQQQQQQQQQEYRDLSSSEISSLVYKTRNIKIQEFKPLRGSEEKQQTSSWKIEKQISSSSDNQTNNNNFSSPTQNLIHGDHNQQQQYQHQQPPPLQQLPPPSSSQQGDVVTKNNRKLFLKLHKILLTRIDRLDQAQEIASILKKLRKQNSIDVIIEKQLEDKFLIPLVSSCDFFLKFEFLVEETLSFTLPIIRQEHSRHILMDDMLSAGALIFSVSSLRQYLSNPNIRTLALELLSSSIDFIQEIILGTDSKFKDRKYACQTFVTHELILHGGTTFLPSLLNYFLQSQSEIGIRRVLKCLKFLILRTTIQVAQSLASSQHFSLLRSCVTILRNFSMDSQRDAAMILTGLSACSLIVSEKLVELNAWEDLRTILANPSLDFSEMPQSWIEKSINANRLIHFKHSSQFPDVVGSFDWENDNDDNDSHPHVSEQKSPSDQPTPNTAPRNATTAPLAALPSSYWLNKKNPKTATYPSSSASFSPNAILPKCKDRLLNSPFGDPRKLIRIQRDRATKARAAQLKFRPIKKNNNSPPAQQSSNSGQGEEEAEGGGSCESEIKSTSQIELPVDFKKTAVVAERLFGGDFDGGGSGGGLPPSQENPTSSIDQLSYEERLTVMMMQIKNNSYESIC